VATLTEKLSFGTDNTVTITLASLFFDDFAISSTIDNSTDKFVAADVQVKIRTGTGTLDNGKVYLFLLRSVDGGTDFDSFTQLSVNASLLVGALTNADSTDYVFSADTSILGLLPSHWKLALFNSTGALLDASAANHSIKFTGKKFEIV